MKQECASRRAVIVFAVRSGQITAREGARRLGVSRKPCYESESRALQVMTETVEDKEPGRPGTQQDEEKQSYSWCSGCRGKKETATSF